MASVYVFDVLNILGFFESHICVADYYGAAQGHASLIARHWLLDRLSRIYYIEPEGYIHLHRLVYNSAILDKLIDNEFDLFKTIGLSPAHTYTARIEGTTLYVTRNGPSGKYVGYFSQPTSSRTPEWVDTSYPGAIHGRGCRVGSSL